MIPFKGERRRFDRSKFRGPVELFWAGANGVTASAIGNCVNVSVFGMSVEFPNELRAGTAVRIEADTTAIPEAAMVCHCRSYGPWFRVGLRFEKPVVQKETTVDSGEIVA